MFFSIIFQNINWEILTKNLVTFNDEMGLRMKNFNIMGVHCVAWTVCKFKRGLAEKERRGVLEGGGVDTPMHTMTEF